MLNLRIAVNSECNLNCFFCHSEGEYPILRCQKKEAFRRLTAEQIILVAKVAADFGVNEIKITGGEPLLRKDIIEIVRGLSSIPGIREVSMVSNGILLEKFASSLKNAGLKRINVSLHSLNPEIYRRITRTYYKNGPEIVLNGIKKALEAGLYPVKINVVVLKDLNHYEIWDFIKLSADLGTPVQFIEYHEPKEVKSKVFRDHYYPLLPLEKKLEKIAERLIVRRMHGRKRFYLKNGAEVEIVRPMFNPEFCAKCTRLRVTSNGEFKPCLMRSDNHVDFYSAFLSDDPEEKLKEYFLEAVHRREPYYKYPVEVELYG